MVAAVAVVVAIERNALDLENDLETVAAHDGRNLVENAPAAENASTASGSALVIVSDTTKTVTEKRTAIGTDIQKEILVVIDIKM